MFAGQSNLFDALRAADEAVERVDRNADDEWKSAALAAICRTAMGKEFLTTDDIWEAMSSHSATTHEPRAMGAVMRQAAAHGWISRTPDYTKSTRKECHARPVAVWLSLLY